MSDSPSERITGLVYTFLHYWDQALRCRQSGSERIAQEWYWQARGISIALKELHLEIPDRVMSLFFDFAFSSAPTDNVDDSNGEPPAERGVSMDDRERLDALERDNTLPQWHIQAIAKTIKIAHQALDRADKVETEYDACETDLRVKGEALDVARAEVESLLDRVAGLKEEFEFQNKQTTIAYNQRDEWRARAEKAEADRDAIAQERDYVRDTLPEHAAIVDKVERLREAIDNVLTMHEQWRIKQVLQAALRDTER